MSDGNDQEKSNDLQNNLRWWVRYAGIPIIVAIIAGIAVVAVAILTRIIPEARIAAPPQTAAPPTVREAPPIINIVVTVLAPPPIAFSATPTPTATFSATPTSTASPTTTLVPIGQHIVQSGETLYCIGRAYGVQPNAIAQANNLVSPFILHSGQILKIPAAPWLVVPTGPTCKPQFASPFAVATSTATAIPATNTPTTTSTGSATPTTTPTATSTATAAPTATSTPTTPIPLWQYVIP